MVKVSVVVPIYNAEKYLKQCLDSIVNQTLREIEIILIDDGSTDGSAGICKQYLSDARVKYYKKSNAGAVMARKDGISLAKGEFVGFVDSDDWIEPNMYEKMYCAATQNSADIVFCNCILNEADHYFSPEFETGVYSRKDIEQKVLPKSLAYITNTGERRAIRWSNCLRLYRRTLIQEGIRYNPEIRRCEDLILTYEATIKANRLVYMGDDYLYHNRVVHNSKSRRYTPDAWSAFKALILHLYEDTERINSAEMMEQMHLRAFFSVIDCLENELKFYQQDKKNAIAEMTRIMNDEINFRYYNQIPIECMNKKYLTYYNAIHDKKPKAILRYKVRNDYMEKVQSVLIRPLIHLISEGKYTKNLYQKVRKLV